jgi:hypothetical protein
MLDIFAAPKNGKMIISRELAKVFIEEVELANREILESYYLLDANRISAAAHRIAPSFIVMGVEDHLYAPIRELTSPPSKGERPDFFSAASSYVRNIRNLEGHIKATYQLQ